MQYPISDYRQVSTIIDWQNSRVQELAHQLAAKALNLSGCVGTTNMEPSWAITKACFEWVRDQVHHSVDYQMNPVTCRASEVLKYRTGYCFAKSHLLAALLRANNIPVGFCYQRLSFDGQGAPYSLHGLNAVHLKEIGWYRIDPRGNRQGIDAQFTPPKERLAYEATLPGEADFQTILPEPLPIVVEVLETEQDWEQAMHHLPDLAPENWAKHGLAAPVN